MQLTPEVLLVMMWLAILFGQSNAEDFVLLATPTLMNNTRITYDPSLNPPTFVAHSAEECLSYCMDNDDCGAIVFMESYEPVSYTHLRAHETEADLVCRLLLEKKNLSTCL